MSEIQAATGPKTDLVHGTGEMVDRVRKFAWERTALGSLHLWSQSLVALSNVVLAHPAPAFLCWSESLVLIYNDAARIVPAVRHPLALGRPASEVWGESWDEFGPKLINALSSGEACYEDGQALQERNDEELHLCRRYAVSPAYEDGRVAGVLLICQEGWSVPSRVRKPLRGREERFRATFREAPVGIMLLDIQGRFLTCNPAYEQLTGRTEAELRELRIFDLTHPDDLATSRATFEKLIRREIEEAYLEKRYRHPDGSVVWVRIHSILLGVDAEEDSQILTIVENIDAYRKAEAALIQNEKLATAKRLAASMSHEINNPLASVMNLVYLSRNTRDMDEVQEYLETAERELRRVAAISGQTLRFHEQATRPVVVQSERLFQDVLAIHQGRIVNSRISVEIRIRTQRAFECFDEEIRQVLDNLLRNALDAMNSTGGRLLLRSRQVTDIETGSESILLTVADTGTGMPASVQGRIFEAFYSTKGIGGAGLGLWISKETVERHAGKLRFRSSQPGGTVFTLQLPCEAVPRSA